MFYKIFFTTFCLLLGYGSVSETSFAEKPDVDYEKQVVCKLGGVEITRGDIAYRQAVETRYADGKETEETTALFTLIRDAINLEVAVVCKMGPTEKEIEAMSLHADRSSQAPQLLADVKAIFGKDIPAYNRLYLAPTITNRKLRSYYSRDRKIHAQAINKIEAAWYDVMNRGDFSKTATKYDLEYKKLTPGRLEDIGNIPGPPGKVEATHNPLSEIVKSMGVGEIHKNIVESDRDFQIIRLAERDGDDYTLEAIIIEKRPYHDWYREQEKKADIVFNDRKLYEQILKRYPDTLWLKDVRLIE